MIDVNNILFEICGDEGVYDDSYDLIENDILDSLTVIDFFTVLEDEGIEIQITRIDRTRLRTPGSIKELVEEYTE
ncbi:MAG: hypothetical protein IJA55_04420 [Clostridia bacterium]|nr:hypothetical protein [Clostridia bacterium]